MESSNATAGLYIPMLSPPFAAEQNYCFLFHYKVWVSEPIEALERSPELEIYLSQTSHAFSGWKIWGSNGTGEGLAQITVWARPGALYRISFVAITYNPLTTLINVANVKLYRGECNSTICNGSMCADKIYNSSTACKLLC